MFALKQKLKGDDNPLNVVLVQEIQRYNVLLNKLIVSLDQLAKGIQGLVVISPDLEEIINALNENKVPTAYEFECLGFRLLLIEAIGCLVRRS